MSALRGVLNLALPARALSLSRNRVPAVFQAAFMNTGTMGTGNIFGSSDRDKSKVERKDQSRDTSFQDKDRGDDLSQDPQKTENWKKGQSLQGQQGQQQQQQQQRDMKQDQQGFQSQQSRQQSKDQKDQSLATDPLKKQQQEWRPSPAGRDHQDPNLKPISAEQDFNDRQELGDGMTSSKMDANARKLDVSKPDLSSKQDIRKQDFSNKEDMSAQQDLKQGFSKRDSDMQQDKQDRTARDLSSKQDQDFSKRDQQGKKGLFNQGDQSKSSENLSGGYGGGELRNPDGHHGQPGQRRNSGKSWDSGNPIQN